MSFTCPNCRTRNPAGSTKCRACGTEPERVRQPEPEPFPPGGEPGKGPGDPENRGDSRLETIEGCVTHVEARDERPPRSKFYYLSAFLAFFLGLSVARGSFNWFIFLILESFPLLLILVIALAFLGAVGMFVSIVMMPLGAVVNGLISWLLRGKSPRDAWPLYRGSLQDEQDDELGFVIRGPLSGNLFAGNRVVLEGRWKQGTFEARGGWNMTTDSRIRSEYMDSWKIVFTAVAIVTFLRGPVRVLGDSYFLIDRFLNLIVNI